MRNILLLFDSYSVEDSLLRRAAVIVDKQFGITGLKMTGGKIILKLQEKKPRSDIEGAQTSFQGQIKNSP